MDDPVLISRWQFAFTIVYHYLFPALTMGLAMLLIDGPLRGLEEAAAQDVGHRLVDMVERGL